MNVFISIIEEAYVASKTKDKNHWIYSYLKVDPQYVEINPEGNEDLKKIEEVNKKISAGGNQTEAILDNKTYDKIARKVTVENTIRDFLNTEKREAFSTEDKKKKEDESIENFKDELTNHFRNCDDLLDEIAKLIPEVKKLEKTDIFKQTVAENISDLEFKVSCISGLWKDK